jgi:glucose/arabinose dehydrogenase
VPSPVGLRFPQQGEISIRRPAAIPALAAGVAVLALAGAAGSATVPSGFIDRVVANGIANPTAMAFDPSGRLFVAEQGGRLRVIKEGKLLATPFVSLSVDSSGERGLLGVAVDPQFSSAGHHYVYVYYTVPGSPPHNRVSRFTASGDQAVSGSQQVLLDVNPLTSATNHNGGAIHFGKDGKLYVGVGDNAEGSNSQSMSTLKGKLLRINPDGTIPSDNPFYNSASGKNRAIWALGVRNPFTFAFRRSTGRLFVNDVGQDTYEEIDDGIAGSNYGWPDCEGPCSPANPAYRDPVFYYAHSGAPTPNGCAITGGAFYDPPVAYFPSGNVGKYFFSDLCSGWIYKVDPANGFAKTQFATGISNPVDLQVGADGSLYYLDHNAGLVGRISYQRPPTVGGFSPAKGVAGTTFVNVNGTYLAGATSVKFNGKAASFTVVSDTRLKAKVPAGAKTGRITVATAAGTAQSTSDFTVTLSVTGFTPSSGHAGDAVTISGIGFTGATAVKFHGTPASFTVQSDTAIKTHVPAGATSGPITVTTTVGTASSAASFSVT